MSEKMYDLPEVGEATVDENGTVWVQGMTYCWNLKSDTDEMYTAASAMLVAADAIKKARNGGSPKDRLYRIALAHVQSVDALGGTDGYCRECGLPHPCPTQEWARYDSTRIVIDTWNPSYDDSDND